LCSHRSSGRSLPQPTPRCAPRVDLIVERIDVDPPTLMQNSRGIRRGYVIVCAKRHIAHTAIIKQLLLGAPRTGRDKTAKDPDPGKAFPGGGIYLGMPGLGDRLAAGIAGEIGEHIGQYAMPNALQCCAGRAPVTRRSGCSEFVVRPAPGLTTAARQSRPAMGVLQPVPVGLGPGVLRRKDRRRRRPQLRAAQTRQPLARGPVALPGQRRQLRRSHPRCQPAEDTQTQTRGMRLTEVCHTRIWMRCCALLRSMIGLWRAAGAWSPLHCARSWRRIS
jgi:hypothetical protein